MTEAIYFVVLKGAKGIYATKYHGHLPASFPDPAIYRLRLDLLDNAEPHRLQPWCKMGLNKLLGMYSQMKAAGKLPAFCWRSM